MRALVFYVVLGALWAMYNLAFVARQFGPEVVKKWAHYAKTPKGSLWIGLSVLLWPLGVLISILPATMTRWILDPFARAFRRAFLDGPKWQEVLSEPPPKLVLTKEQQAFQASYEAWLETVPTCEHCGARMFDKAQEPPPLPLDRVA